MHYPKEIVEDVREKTDIVDLVSEYVKLEKAGNNFKGLCPFHNEKTPSFIVNPDKQFYYCFGCGAGGNSYTFLMEQENFDFPEAVKHLANRLNITLPEENVSEEMKKKYKEKETLYEINKKAMVYFYEAYNSNKGFEAKKYVSKREINPEMRKKFALGYSFTKGNDLFKYLVAKGYKKEDILKAGLITEKNGKVWDRFWDRLMFPILDAHDRVIGFGGRIIGQGEPKYLNSPETLVFNKSENLYNMNLARKERPKYIILTEGYMDTIALYQVGFKNVVAALGTAFNESHAKVIKKYTEEVIISFDSDNAGKKAILRAIPHLRNAHLKIRVLDLRDTKDPDEFVNKYGKREFEKQIKDAISYVEFEINILKEKYDISDPYQKIDFTREISKVFEKIEDGIEREVFVNKIAVDLKISSKSIQGEIEKEEEIEKKQNKYKEDKKEEVVKKVIHRDVYDEFFNIIVGSKEIFESVKDHVTELDFEDEFYRKLYEIIKDAFKVSNYINIAEIADYFNDKEEQKAVIAISNKELLYPGKPELEKGLTQVVINIKKDSIDEKIKSADGEERLALTIMKNNLKKIKINL